jgi:hypothetical protein
VDRSQSRHQEPRTRPLLIISGEKDNTVPWAIANAAQQPRPSGALRHPSLRRVRDPHRHSTPARRSSPPGPSSAARSPGSPGQRRLPVPPSPQ